MYSQAIVPDEKPGFPNSGLSLKVSSCQREKLYLTTVYTRASYGHVKVCFHNLNTVSVWGKGS